MEKTLLENLSDLLSKEDRSELIFVSEEGNEVSLDTAVKQKIKGTVVEKKFSKKEEISKLLFGKERMGIEDLLSAIETFEKTIYTLWENSGYAFKSKNYAHLKTLLSKYNVKEISKRENHKIP